jgi:hypothetical protein
MVLGLGLMIIPCIYSGSLVCLLGYLLCQNKTNVKEIDKKKYEKINTKVIDLIDNE